MCACGCFVVAALVAALIYTVMHGFWLPAIAIVVIAAAVGWFGRKAATFRPKPRI